ncbi:MAG: alpha/beta hydrolase [Pseudomonadota bacterium]
MPHSQIRKAYADCSAGQIHYRYLASDNGNTPIVWLHQTASSSAMYIKVMEHLNGIAPMYALDTPGFGGSFDAEDMPSMSQFSSWLLEAIDDIGIGEFHAFGHHTGACLVAEMATKCPGRLKSAMMIGPLPLTKDEREEFRQHFSTPMSPNTSGTYLQQTWDYLAELGADHELELHHRELLDTVRAYMGRYKAYSSVWDQDFTALYKQIDCPLFIMCAEDDVLWPFFSRAQEIRPDAKHLTIRGANFEPDLDALGVANGVADFLKGLSK